MSALRLGFVPGVTPDKWARRWRDLPARPPLELVPLGESDDGVAMLREGELTMCLVRLPVDTTDLHLVRLYDEQPVVVASREHPVAVFERVDVEELSDELLLDAADGARQAVETVAAGTGLVVLPMSVARLHHRRDVVAVPLSGVPVTVVGLAWLRERDDEVLQELVGVVRGRTSRSSR